MWYLIKKIDVPNVPKSKWLHAIKTSSTRTSRLWFYHQESRTIIIVIVSTSSTQEKVPQCCNAKGLVIVHYKVITFQISMSGFISLVNLYLYGNIVDYIPMRNTFMFIKTSNEHSFRQRHLTKFIQKLFHIIPICISRMQKYKNHCNIYWVQGHGLLENTCVQMGWPVVRVSIFEEVIRAV